jgi:hypothetical protein
MLKLLNRPYPFSFQPSRRIKQLLPIGLGVFIFLLLFKPFGLGNDPYFIQTSAYFAFSGTLIGFLTTVVIPYFFPHFFNESGWTLKRNLIWSLCIYFTFATLMFIAFNLYSIFRYDSFHFFTFQSYLWWIYLNLIFGVPLGIIVNLINQYYLLKKHLSIADNINKTIRKELEDFPVMLLEFEIDKFNKVEFEVGKLVYVEALGNYINIVYDCNGIRKITVRETIVNIEQQIDGSGFIYKPHRSYLVNMKNIEKVTGDSQGLKIHLNNSDKIIPVSRNKIKEFRKLVSVIL